MKKVLLLIFLVSSFFVADAQKFGWGITAGPSLAYIGGKNNNGVDLVGREIRTGFHGGFIFQYNPRRFFTIYSGIEYVQKGVVINAKTNGFRSQSALNELRSSYLEVPALIKLNLDPYSDIRPNVFFGPSFGFLLEAKDNFTLPQSSADAGNPLLTTERYYRWWDPGLTIGGGLDIDVGEWTIFTMGAQYTFGTNRINGNDGYWFSEEADLKNRNVRLNFGLLFVIPTYTMNNSKKIENYDKFKKYLY